MEVGKSENFVIYYNYIYIIYINYIRVLKCRWRLKAKAAQMIHSGWFKFQGKPLDFFRDIDSFFIIFPLTH